MNIFKSFVNWIAAYVPDWVGLIVCPAALVLVALLLTLFGGRKAYPAVAAVLGGAGSFLVACGSEPVYAIAYVALFAAAGGLLSLLFFLPCPFGDGEEKEKTGKRKRGEKRTRRSREERIFRRFHEALEAQEYESFPPRVVSEEQPSPAVTAQECGMRLEYVLDLLEKLKQEKLSAADRLEVEVLTRAVEADRGKQLTEEELGRLNDSLASVLKFTAKYKL